MKYLKLMEGDPIVCPVCPPRRTSATPTVGSIHKEEHMELFRCECQWCGEEFRVEIYTDERHMKGVKDEA